MRSHRLETALRALWQTALSLAPTRPVRLRKFGTFIVIAVFAAYITLQRWESRAIKLLTPTVAARDITASPLALVSAANYEATVAPDSIAAIFGVNLATATLEGGDSDPNNPGIQLPRCGHQRLRREGLTEGVERPLYW